MHSLGLPVLSAGIKVFLELRILLISLLLRLRVLIARQSASVGFEVLFVNKLSPAKLPLMFTAAGSGVKSLLHRHPFLGAS